MTKKTRKSRENSGQSDNDDGTRFSQNEEEENNQEAAGEVQIPEERDSSSKLVKEDENNSNTEYEFNNSNNNAGKDENEVVELENRGDERLADREMEGKGKELNSISVKKNMKKIETIQLHSHQTSHPPLRFPPQSFSSPESL